MGGDVALSVTLTALSSVITLFTIPLIMSWATDRVGESVGITLPVGNLIKQNLLLMLLPAGPQDHEDHCADADGNSYSHFNGKGLSKQEGPYQYGRQGFEHPEYGSLGGSYITGRYRQGKQRNHSRDNGKTDEVSPVGGAVYTLGEASSLNGPDYCKKDSPCQQSIERKRMLGYVLYPPASVHDDKVKGIAQGRCNCQDNAGKPDDSPGRGT